MGALETGVALDISTEPEAQPDHDAECTHGGHIIDRGLLWRYHQDSTVQIHPRHNEMYKRQFLTRAELTCSRQKSTWVYLLYLSQIPPNCLTCFMSIQKLYGPRDCKDPSVRTEIDGAEKGVTNALIVGEIHSLTFLLW